MKRVIATFLEDESTATVVEYGLITALIAVGIIAGATAVGVAIDSSFQNLADNNFAGEAGDEGGV